jgi:putative ATPase
MIEGGEEVSFIARRLLISASEDIGNANPTAMVMATSTMSAVQMIGYPESRIILAQLAIYLACSPKSNASYEAINKAQQLVATTGDLPVPLHLRNAPTKLMKQLDYGKAYLYPHTFEGNFVEQQYMPDALNKTKLYEPGNNPRENELKNYLKSKWKNKY